MAGGRNGRPGGGLFRLARPASAVTRLGPGRAGALRSRRSHAILPCINKFLTRQQQVASDGGNAPRTAAGTGPHRPPPDRQSEGISTYGDELVRLARLTDELAGHFQIPTIFTAQHADLRLLAEHTLDLTITAQHMDPIAPGRGIGHVLPESLVDAGARAVVLNHAEHPLSLADLDATMERAGAVGLSTIVCADSDAQCRAIAHLGPDAMICPKHHRGDRHGAMDAGDYIERPTAIVKGVDPSILVIQAAGVSSGADVARVLSQGADGSGGTSGIIKHPDWRAILTEMYSAIRDHAAATH